MDVAQILGQLWKQRGLMLLGAVLAIVVGMATAYKPTLSPLGLEKKSLELGTASTQIVIDTQKSSVIDLSGDLAPLTSRGQTYTLLGSSDPVRGIIARKMGLPAAAINTGAGSSNPTEDQRANQIVNEKDVYRVTYASSEKQPVVAISTQAPTAAAAAKLANSAASAIRDYVVKQQDAQNVRPFRRVVIRQLGTARGGVINSGANLAAALLGALATFVGACLVILFGSRLRADLRRSRRTATAAAPGQVPLYPIAGRPRGAYPQEHETAVRRGGEPADEAGDRRESRPRG